MRRYQDSIALSNGVFSRPQGDLPGHFRGFSMTVSRVVEFSFSFIIAFLVLILISFLTLRPMLKGINLEARADWDAFRRAVAERNELLPGMMEGLRGFQPGLAKLAEKVIETRGISLRAVDQDAIVASVDAHGWLSRGNRKTCSIKSRSGEVSPVCDPLEESSGADSTDQIPEGRLQQDRTVTQPTTDGISSERFGSGVWVCPSQGVPTKRVPS